MVAEFIAWRGCALQRELGPDGFVSRLKLLGMKRAIDARVEDAAERETSSIAVRGRDGAAHDLPYTDIAAAARIVESGIPDCASCILSHQQPVGCWTSVLYPIGAEVERLLFDFFVATVVEVDSSSFELWRDIVRHQPKDSPWHLMRDGAEPRLAELSEPLVATVTLADGQELTVDSAMLLSSLFLTSEGNAQVVAYHKWWTLLLNFSERPGAEPVESSTWSRLLEVRRLYLRAFIYGMHEPVGLLVDL